jgi:hypothetical protein
MSRGAIHTSESDLHPAREALNSWGSFILLFLFSATPAITIAILTLASRLNTSPRIPLFNFLSPLN